MNKKYYIQMLGFAFLTEKLGIYDLDLFERNSSKISKNKRYFYENKHPNKKYFSLGNQIYHNKTLPRDGKNKKTQGVHYQAKSRARRKKVRKNLGNKVKNNNT